MAEPSVECCGQWAVASVWWVRVRGWSSSAPQPHVLLTELQAMLKDVPDGESPEPLANASGAGSQVRAAGRSRVGKRKPKVGAAWRYRFQAGLCPHSPPLGFWC